MVDQPPETSGSNILAEAPIPRVSEIFNEGPFGPIADIQTFSVFETAIAQGK